MYFPSSARVSRINLNEVSPLVSLIYCVEIMLWSGSGELSNSHLMLVVESVLMNETVKLAGTFPYSAWVVAGDIPKIIGGTAIKISV